MNLNHFYHYYKSKSGGLSNLLLGSEELDQSDQGEWVRYNMNAVNADQVNNPSGTEQTAEQLDFEASRTARIAQTVTLTAGTEYTFSVWARAASGTEPFRLRYWDNVGGSGGGSAFTASATWSASTGRYEMTFTAQNSGTFQVFIQNAADGATRRIYFWGAMLNVGGAALDYVKTEFPTGPSNPPTAPMEFGDNFAGVTAYYSLRRFTKGEDNNAIRVRRSSDDTEQDIGFDANGDLDTTALLAFVGTGGTDNGFVTTFYDQSGNGNNATNATESEQPLVVSGGTLVTENGKAALDFDGTSDAFNFTELNLGDNSWFINAVYKSTRTTLEDYFLYGDSGNTRIRIYETNVRFYISNVTYSYNIGSHRNTQQLFSFEADASKGLSVYKNGTEKGTEQTIGTGDSFDPSSIGQSGSSRTIDGLVQEIIIFNSDQSSNRTGMETNINDHFSIYP